MKNKMFVVLIFMILMNSFILVSPNNDLKAVETESQSSDVKHLLNDFISTSKNDVSNEDITNYLDYNPLNMLATGTGIAFDSEYVFNAAETNNVSVASLSATKFVIVYRDDGNSGYGTAVIGDISGKTITYGSEYVFNPASTNDVSVASLSSTKFVVVFNDTGNFGSGTAVIGDVSGNTISYGSEYMFNFDYTHHISVDSLNANQFVVVYRRYGSFGYARAGGVSGNSITFGWEDDLRDQASPPEYTSVCALSNDYFMVVYNIMPFDNRMAPGGVFGGDAHMDDPWDFEMSVIDNVSITTLPPSEFLITYSDTEDSDYGKGFMGKNENGWWHTPFGQFVFHPDTTGCISASALSSSKFIIGFEDVANSGYGTAMLFEHSGWNDPWTITYSSEEYVFNPDTTSQISVADLSMDQFVIAYKDNGNSGYGTAIIGEENSPPDTPDTPDGPSILGVGELGLYSTSGIEPDGDQLQYRFDWDADGAHSYSSWTSLDVSGHIDSIQKYWTIGGTYLVKAQSRDQYGSISDWSSGFTVDVQSPPLTPSIPSGPASLLEGRIGTYSTSAIDPNDDRLQYRFDWNDGIISGWTSLVDSGQSSSMSHSWDIPGTYYLRSQSRDELGYISGWSDSLTLVVIENRPPVADSNGPYIGTVNLPVQFDGSGSYDSDGAIVSYDWDFGDGESGSGMTPTHEYDTPDTYSIILTVEDDNGKTDIDATIAEIFSQPIADADGPYEGIVGIPVEFNGSTTGGKTPLSYYWSFGDATYSGAQSPSHIYDEEGRYPVSLRVTDDIGIIDTDGTSVIIKPATELVADAHGPYTGNVGESIQFTGSVDGGSDPYEWYWDFGDGASSIQQNPTHAYTATGSFTATLIVEDTYGVTDDDTAQISIISHPPNTPQITGPASGKAGDFYEYTIQAHDDDGDDMTYHIEWGDDTFDEGIIHSDGEEVLTHSWSEQDIYNIRVKVTDIPGGLESDWTFLEVEMPISKTSLFEYPILHWLKYWLLERLPILNRI